MSTPMGRDEVLAVLDNEMASYKHIPFLLRDGVTVDFTEAVDRLEQARSAVAAIYERCEALELAALKLPIDAFNKNWVDAADFVDHSSDFLKAMNALRPLLNGTEPSDAEGGK